MNTEVMGINESVSEDPHEFYQRFFQAVEEAKLSTTGDTKSSFHDLLDGSYSYVAKCMSCGVDHPSETIVEFRELVIPVVNGATLEKALDSYICDDVLDGYPCTTCYNQAHGALNPRSEDKHYLLRSANRRIDFTKLPPVLNILLARPAHPGKSHSRKATISVSFPEELRVGKDSYKLVSALYHTSLSVMDGHYTCDALDWGTKQWWHCNDDTVAAITSPCDQKTTCNLKNTRKAKATKYVVNRTRDVSMLTYVKAADFDDYVSKKLIEEELSAGMQPTCSAPLVTITTAMDACTFESGGRKLQGEPRDAHNDAKSRCTSVAPLHVNAGAIVPAFEVVSNSSHPSNTSSGLGCTVTQSTNSSHQVNKDISFKHADLFLIYIFVYVHRSGKVC